MGTGFARGAAARGVTIAFGDRRRLIWGPWCEEAFRHNPNVARQLGGSIEWVEYYKGNRGYNRQDNGRARWIWNYDFRAVPGEFYFTQAERAKGWRRPGVLIEPNLPWHKSVAVNKDWGLARYQALADMLRRSGIDIYQTSFGKARISGAIPVPVSSYREAAATLAGFDCIVCPEGGLHHAAAAIGARAVVLFGGFIPPAVTGYDSHVNLTGGAEACGSWQRCDHCRQALDRISVEQVFSHAQALCRKAVAAS